MLFLKINYFFIKIPQGTFAPPFHSHSAAIPPNGRGVLADLGSCQWKGVGLSPLPPSPAANLMTLNLPHRRWRILRELARNVAQNGPEWPPIGNGVTS